MLGSLVWIRHVLCYQTPYDWFYTFVIVTLKGFYNPTFEYPIILHPSNWFQRSRAEAAQKAEAEYRKLLAQRAKDAKEKKKERRRSSLSKSKTSVSSN